MLIAHVQFTVSAKDRAAALKALLTDHEKIRAMPGCLAFIPFVDPTNDTGLGVLHEWQSPDDFAAYTSSDNFSTMSQALRPMMTSAPISHRFDATQVNPVD